MKKLIVYSIFIVLSIVSCSKNNHVNDIDDTPVTPVTSVVNQEYINLINELEVYNSNFNVETRFSSLRGGFWRRLGRVALADCIGFLGGSFLGPGAGLGFGVFSSAMAAMPEIITVIETRSVTTEVALSNDLLYTNVALDDLEACDLVGEIHNQILDEIYSEYPECFETFTEEQWINVITEKIIELFPDEPAVDINSYRSESAETISIIMDPDNDLDAAFDALKVRLPLRCDELEVVRTYCETVNSIEENQGVIDYTDGFREIVVGSDINDDSKQYIQSAISVAGNSQLLWSECVIEPVL
jgi:hypothetical protein